MKVKKSELMSVLELVRPGLAKKEVVEQAQHFIFSGEDVATFNDKICIIHPFKTDIAFSVNGNDLYKIIGKIDSDIELKLEDENLKISAKGTNAKLSTIVGEAAMVTHLIESIRQAMIGKNFWKPVPKDFTEGIYLCAFAASKAIDAGITSCCAIRNDAIYTTDALRVSMYIMENKMETVLLPAQSASELVKYKVTEYGISENWAHFRTADGTLFNCKIMKGDYPFEALEAIFTEDEPLLQFPANLQENVDAVKILAEGETEVAKFITVTVGKGRIVCKAEEERGWIQKTVECDYEGENLEFLINPVFFGQVLSHATSFALINTGDSPKGMFLSDNFYHVLSLPTND